MKNLTEKISEFETMHQDVLIEWLKLARLNENDDLEKIEQRLNEHNLSVFENNIDKDIILTYIKYSGCCFKPISFDYSEPTVDLVLGENVNEIEKNITVFDDSSDNTLNTDYILSLPFEDGVKHITDIIDNSYKYMKQNDKENDVVEKFLAQDCFIPYYNNILGNLKNDVM